MVTGLPRKISLGGLGPLEPRPEDPQVDQAVALQHTGTRTWTACQEGFSQVRFQTILLWVEGREDPFLVSTLACVG